MTTNELGLPMMPGAELTPGELGIEAAMQQAADDDHPRLVALRSGETLAEPEERVDGVLTDAGLIGWEHVAGFWTWHAPSRRYFFVPVD